MAVVKLKLYSVLILAEVWVVAFDFFYMHLNCLFVAANVCLIELLYPLQFALVVENI